MNTINVTEQKNTVTVNETTNTVTVTEGVAATVQITTQGPQGPAISGVNFDISGKVNDAVLYYHAASDTIKADSTTTKLTLVDGGNF